MTTRKTDIEKGILKLCVRIEFFVCDLIFNRTCIVYFQIFPCHNVLLINKEKY